MKTRRLIAILLYLESRGRMKAKDLANALGVTERTIHRDIELLTKAGVPVDALAGPAGGFSLIEGYTQTGGVVFGGEVSLYLSGVGSGYCEPDSATGSLHGILQELESVVPGPFKRDISLAQSRLYFDPHPWWLPRHEAPCLEAIRRALWRTHKVALEYTKPKGKVAKRVVRPYGLVVKSMLWYLVALCEKSNEVRVYPCVKIQKATELPSSYFIPEMFCLETYWQTYWSEPSAWPSDTASASTG